MGSNCWRPFMRSRAFVTRVMCPARIPRRCYGARFMSQLHGGWGGRCTTQWVELRSASVPKIVQVPGWWRRDLPLCLPNVQSRKKEVADKDPCLPAEEVPIRAIDEVAGVAFRTFTRGDRSTYRKVKRHCPPPPPQEASPNAVHGWLAGNRLFIQKQRRGY